MIIDGNYDHAIINQQAVKEGIKTLYERAVGEVLNGQTTLDELMRVVEVRES